MRLRPSTAAFAAFAALFAALAVFVFWGTWGLDAAPVMPDCPVWHPQDHLARWFAGWLESGKFVPGDVKEFLGSPYFWQELQYAAALFFAALGAAYFLKGRGLSRVSSYGAGLLLAFCGYWCSLFSAGHLGWFRWMTYGVFAFALADRAARKGKPRHWIFLGATLAWGSFYQPDLWLLFTVFTAAYFLFASVKTFIEAKRCGGARGFVLSRALGALGALAVFAAIGFPSFRSAIVNDLAGRDSQISSGETLPGGALDQAERRWIFVTNWSMPPEDTLEFVVPRIHGDTSCPNVLSLGARQGSGVKPYTGRLGRPYGADKGNYRQHSLYVGWVTCVLAVLGTVYFRRLAEVRFFAAAAAVFWLFSMGRYCEPIYRLVYALPMGDYLRAPVKWHHLTEFCICMLAGWGLESVYRLLAAKGVKRGTAACAVFAVAVFGACDLARVDRLYLAVMDISAVRGRNDAADDVKSLGGGKVADFIEGGYGLAAWSFASKGIEMSADPAGARFLWMPVAHAAAAGSRLKAAGFEMAGTYDITAGGIRRSARGRAVLYFSRNVKTPVAEKKSEGAFPATGAVSASVTLAVVFGGMAAFFVRMRRRRP